MLKAFKTHIDTKFPKLLQSPFLLACSGGIDSMVLTDLCVKCGMDFALAHCNFQLRGADSDADEKFVFQTAARLKTKFYVSHFNTSDYVVVNKVSVQMAARELRYAWFAEIMHKNGIETLVTAHHADDNLETFLINLSRGTGIGGLTGIPEKTDSLSRPLLAFSREQINSYAMNEHIEWREDNSNSETKYIRNNIRHQILPLLKTSNPDFLMNFRDTQKYLSQTAAIADNYISQLKAVLFLQDGERIRISTKTLAELRPLEGYLYGLFGAFGFREWNDVKNLLTAMSGKEVRSKTHRLVKDRDFLLLTKINFNKNRTYYIQESDTNIEKPVHMNITAVDTIGEIGTHILYASKKTLKYPLTLRKWEQGDYFYPFGMKGSKKLSKFFKDEKIDIITKENQWLLCSGDAIVWVIGKRADERFKVSENTIDIIKFKFKS